MADRIHLGIDPGKTGGMAAIYPSMAVHQWRFSQVTSAEIARDLQEMVKGFDCRCIIEKVASSPQMGVKSAFTFGAAFGEIQGVLTAVGIPYDLATPVTWMKEYGLRRSKTESASQWKRRLRTKAEQLHPGAGVQRETADAVLLAEYCRRRWAQP